MFYICKKCGNQFVKVIQPCPDCNSSDGFQLIEKKGQPVLTQTTGSSAATVTVGQVKEAKVDKKKKKR